MRWLLHGAIGMAADWEAGEDDRPVDLWSYLATDGISCGEFGERFSEEVAAADPEPVLVGYSLGGRLALHCLLARPDLWKAAVIVGAHPGLPDEKSRLERMADDAEWAGKALTADWEKFLAEWEGQGVFTATGEEPAWEDRRKLETQRQAVARGFMEWSLGKQADLRPRLLEIACPVLWITGGQDQKFTALAQECVPRLANGRHEVVQDAGHRVPWERPARFRLLVDAFLHDTLPPAPVT